MNDYTRMCFRRAYSESLEVNFGEGMCVRPGPAEAVEDDSVDKSDNLKREARLGKRIDQYSAKIETLIVPSR